MASLVASMATKPLISEELLSKDGLKSDSPENVPKDGLKGSSSTLPERDIESGETLIPGLDSTETARRWGFIRKASYCVFGVK